MLNWYGVADEALLPLAVERLVNPREVEPVDVGVDLVQVVSVVGFVRVCSSGKSEKVGWVVLLERVAHLLHQQREMLPVQRICGHLRQHVVSRELPVEVDPVKSEVVHEVDRALDEHLPPLPSLSHVGEDPASSGPATDGKENFQVWVLLLQCKGPTDAIMFTIRQAPLGCTSWGPNVPVPLLDAVLDRLLAKVNGPHVEPGIPCANFIRVV